MQKPFEIAVVGMGGVFPGAPDTATFWRNICDARSAISDAPPERWIAPAEAVVRSAPEPDKALGRRCGLVTGLDFDPDGFTLPASEIRDLDPLYHLVLQAGREAVAGGCLRRVHTRRAGTILAAIALPTNGSSLLAHHLFSQAVAAQIDPAGKARLHPPSRAACRAARVTGFPAAVLASALDLGGGGYTLDAACASSLYAVRLACDALTAGRLDAVLAGGVSRPDCLYTQIGFSQLRALSPSGRCAPFDAGADGLVVGEGAGILVLKRLADAVAAGDPIHAVIRAAGLSNDMRGNLLAPEVLGQVRAMHNAYRQAGWIPGRVDLIECHGAGTPVGDRTEIESLHRLIADNGPPPGACAIGSIKSMIGHLLTAAGAAGLIKTILAMQNRVLPPSLNFTTPADARLDGSGPFRVQTRASSWEPVHGDGLRRAAVSAFGFGGINAHLLMEQWRPEPSVRQAAHVATQKPMPVAIVGLAARVGSREGLSPLADGAPYLAPLSDRRWRGLGRMADRIFTQRPRGAFVENLEFPAGRFRIPPSEIPDLLAQQLLMLQVGAAALADAGLPVRDQRPRMGTVIGMEFDPQATDFYLRWRWTRVGDRCEPESQWPADLDDPQALAAWRRHLGQAVSPPLTPTRTVGNLGGIVASRLAREFGLGGPSFGVSAQALGGLQALEIAVRFLQQGEADLMLAGAVELTGDLRNLVANHVLDGLGGPQLPVGEGALALVLKRLDDARSDGDRIHAVIEGIGAASGTWHDQAPMAPEVLVHAATAAFEEAGPRAGQIDGVAPLGTGFERIESVENEALAAIFDPDPAPPADTALPICGFAGCAAGLTALVRAVLRMDGCSGPAGSPASDEKISPPPHRAVLVGGPSTDGGALYLVLSGGGSGRKRDAAQSPDNGAKIAVPVSRPLQIPPLPPGPAARSAGEPSISRPNEEDPAAALNRLVAGSAAMARAHEAYLDLSLQLRRQYIEALGLQARLGAALASEPGVRRPEAGPPSAPGLDRATGAPRTVPPAFDRGQCLEFARGLAAKVLGPAFAEVDGFAVRVRLPDEPLMLVDRILAVEGEPRSLTSGRVVTEHDVLPDAWYLDGGRAPVCIAVEAGQADLFLCSYLGIDHQVRGKRSYRLLDAKVRFHRGLPRPGETVRYEICIDRFVRQAGTWLFFFRFEGTVAGQPLISMRNGCAGFFTPREVRDSGGIVLTEAERKPEAGRLPEGFTPPVAVEACTLDETQVEALRQGDLGAAFGSRFDGILLPPAQRLPGGRMRLIHRVRRLDPAGGRYGIGTVEAEADIDPEDWFLVCHFVDDPVMPGTLMYECCAHALRVFFQRLGWISPETGAGFEPIEAVEAVLKCRGPVTPETRQVLYRVDVRELGYGPEPFIIADAHMYADGEHIVMFQGMSLRLSGVTRDEIEAFWSQREATPTTAPNDRTYPYERILAFAVGRPSEAFGDAYRIFDDQRRIARLPGPPYLFMDRIVAVEPEPWRLEPGGWVTAEYTVPRDAWYLRADRSGGGLPYCVLLEIALQPCGWLAAYLGSALHSQQDLKFRNLGGTATIHRTVDPAGALLTMRVRLKQVSEAARMIIETFDMEVCDAIGPVYSGETTFGFFSAKALANQVGIRNVEERFARLQTDPADGGSVLLEDFHPLTPDDPATTAGVGMPALALRMIDSLQAAAPGGAAGGLGYLRGLKTVNPQEWFFTAHFFQDPVCPGSLGIESFLQLLRFDLLSRSPQEKAPLRFEPLTGLAHRWIYRGQIIPRNRQVTVEAAIRERGTPADPFVRADGLVSVDGRAIYHLQDFGLRMVQTDCTSGQPKVE